MALLRIRQDANDGIGGLSHAPLKNASNEQDQTNEGYNMNYDSIAAKKDLIKRIDDKLLLLSSDRCEVELELVRALIEFPDEAAFHRQKMEFAGMFKNTSWEDADYEKTSGEHTTAETSRPCRSGPMVIYLGSSSEKHRRTSSAIVCQSNYSRDIEVSAANATPVRVEPPPQFNVDVGVGASGTHRNMRDKGKGIASDDELTVNQGKQNLGEENMPTFDLGISPDKPPKKEPTDNEKGNNIGRRTKKPSDKLRSPLENELSHSSQRMKRGKCRIGL